MHPFAGSGSDWIQRLCTSEFESKGGTLFGDLWVAISRVISYRCPDGTVIGYS